MSKRIVVIGHTGKGDYGHGLDQAFVGVEGAEIVALADPDAEGRRRFAELTGAPAAYADYREMLAAEKPDIAVIATHEMSGHLEMVLAAAAAGAHVYVEKPLATTLGEVDRMLDACDRAGVLLVMAHPWRGRPQIQQHAIPMIRGGEIGEPRWVRLYGHPSGRPTSHNGVFSGDAWMIDLYPHLFDFACQLFGAPLWCQSLITTDGRPATPDDLVEGPFGMGPTAGNGVAAQFQFQECTVEFVSYWASGTGWQHGESLPYGAEVHGTAGTLCLPGPTIEGPDLYLHPFTHSHGPTWGNPHPALAGAPQWQVLAHEEVQSRQKWVNAHHRMARSLLDLLDGRQPEYELCIGQAARLLVEMATAVRLAHIRGARVPFPVTEAGNPFESWRP